MDQYKRHVAYKLTIHDVLAKQFVEQDATTPSHIVLGDTRVVRVNLMGIVVSTQHNPLPSLLIDDGTARISVRLMDQSALPVDVGQTAVVIGRIRELQGERSISAEIIKPVDQAWLQVRKQEYFQSEPVQAEESTPEPTLPAPTADELITHIKTKDEGSGVDIEELLAELKLENGEALISHLIKQGEIFEIRPGVVKVLE